MVMQCQLLDTHTHFIIRNSWGTGWGIKALLMQVMNTLKLHLKKLMELSFNNQFGRVKISNLFKPHAGKGSKPSPPVCSGPGEH